MSVIASARSVSEKPISIFKRGKIRELYDFHDHSELHGRFDSRDFCGEYLAIFASNRISAFDVILPNHIPQKGELLTRLSDFWFQKTEPIIRNHRSGIDDSQWNEVLKKYPKGSSVIVHKADPLPIECVVRGYLAGSAWKEYQAKGSVCDVKLPKGLRALDALPEPIFTPSTKASSGHDQGISFDVMSAQIGKEKAAYLREISLALYSFARDLSRTKDIIIADTKFEFGIHEGKIILIDEAFTPDSSRFWRASTYLPNQQPECFDKQIVRDYLETLDWDKTSPAPELPAEIIRQTRHKYIELFEMLTGKKFD